MTSCTTRPESYKFELPEKYLVPPAAKKGLPSLQLYDMATDVGETRNLEDAQPQVVERLATILGHYVVAGRSTPGSRRV